MILRQATTSPSDSTLNRQGLKRVVVIVPAYNEEASVGLVLKDLPEVGHVIVVDNGSTDQTASIAKSHGAQVVREPRKGYGQACLAGLAAINRSADCSLEPEIVVFVDGDYSDFPELLPDLVRPILSDAADFVIGSRALGNRERGSMTPPQVFGNGLACTLIRCLWGVRFTDLGPFRAIRYDALKALEMADTNFGWTVEMQIKAARARLRVTEIAVPYRRRIGKSKISGTVLGTIKAGYKILFTIFRYSCIERARVPLIGPQKSTSR